MIQYLPVCFLHAKLKFHTTSQLGREGVLWDNLKVVCNRCSYFWKAPLIQRYNVYPCEKCHHFISKDLINPDSMQNKNKNKKTV
jgi:hypothetical protein